MIPIEALKRMLCPTVAGYEFCQDWRLSDIGKSVVGNKSMDGIMSRTNEELQAEVAMLRALLTKYIDHVWKCEGTDFLYKNYAKFFTPEEFKTLHELSGWEGEPRL